MLLAGSGSLFKIPPQPSGAERNFYRCVYVQSSVSADDVKVWIQADTPDANTTIALGWAAAGVGVTESGIANESTVPSGVTFASPASRVAAADGGDFTTGQFRALWIRFRIAANATPNRLETFRLGASGIAAVGSVAPSITSNGGNATAAISVAEGETFVTTLTASGNPAGAWSIIGGADAAAFGLVGNDLEFVDPKDYEIPSDANSDNAYEVTVSVQNASGSDTQAITVNVTDVVEGGALAHQNVPASSYPITQNQTYSLAQHATGGTPPYTYDVDNPSGLAALGITLNTSTGLLTASGSASVGESTASFQFGVTDSAVALSAPVISGGASQNFPLAEGQTAVASFTVTGSPTPSVTLGGADAAFFSYNGGVLTISARDFESPVDANADNVYICTLTATNSQGTFVKTVTVSITDVNEGGGVSTLNQSITLLPTSTGVHPYVFGHGFKQGDVKAGDSIVVNAANYQSAILTTWPDDGSARTALIAISDTFSSTVTPKSFTLTGGAAPAGTALTESAITSSGHTASIQIGSIGTVSLASVIGLVNNGTRNSKGLVANRVSGPLMSEFKYYSNVGSDLHLAVFITVRIFSTGRMWIRFTVENGWFKVANPGQKDYTATITVNGAQKLSEAITHLHHTRWSMEYWTGADSGIIPTHNKAYLKSTKLLPNFQGGMSEANLASLTQTVVPYQQANIPTTLGDGGFSYHIGIYPRWDVAAIVSNDVRAWKGLIANAHALGKFGLFYRDETTMIPPLPSSYLQWSIDSGGSYDENGAGVNMTPAPSGGVPQYWSPSHPPAPPLVAALLTADDYYIETCGFMAITKVLTTGTIARNNLSLLGGQVRTLGWGMLTLFQAAGILPSGTLRNELMSVIGNNMTYRRSVWVDGSRANNMGAIHFYAGGGEGSTYDPGNGKWVDAPWMHKFTCLAFAYGWDLGLPYSTQQKSNHQVLRDHCYKLPIGLAGDGSAGTWCFRAGGVYSMPFLQQENQDTGAFYTNFGDAYAAFNAYYSIPNFACTPGSHWMISATADAAGQDQFLQASGWITQTSCLAFAEDHGVAGASQALDRLQASSTYTTYEPQWQNDPLWSIKPR